AGTYIAQFTSTTASLPIRCNISTTPGGNDIFSFETVNGINSFSFTIPTNGTYYINFQNSGNYYAYVKEVSISADGSPYSLSTTYTENEIFDITYAQFGRILYLFHSSHPIASLTWTNDNS